GVHLTRLRGAAATGYIFSGRPPQFPRESSIHRLVIQPTAWEDAQAEIEEATVTLLAKYMRGLGGDAWSYNQLLPRAEREAPRCRRFRPMFPCSRCPAGRRP